MLNWVGCHKESCQTLFFKGTPFYPGYVCLVRQTYPVIRPPAKEALSGFGPMPFQASPHIPAIRPPAKEALPGFGSMPCQASTAIRLSGLAAKEALSGFGSMPCQFSDLFRPIFRPTFRPIEMEISNTRFLTNQCAR